MQLRPTATILTIATILGTLAAAGAVQAGPAPVNPVCGVTAPVEEANPGQDAVCEAEASAEANVSAPGYPGPCIQVYPYSEVCDGLDVGLEADAGGDGQVFTCLDTDAFGRACGPVYADPQPDGLTLP